MIALIALIAQLKADGVTIICICISHKLDEVERVTDEIVVLRDGRFVTRSLTMNVPRQQIANPMVGRDLSDLYPPKDARPALHTPPLLKVQALNVPGWACDVNFEVAPGEIPGVAGLVGAGRTGLFEGLHVNFGLHENLTLMALRRNAAPWLKPAAEKTALKTAVTDFGIRTGSLDVKASALSGGNQQKLALAKVLHPAPKVVGLDEPTRGVDVGAKRDIYFLIQRLARVGPRRGRHFIRTDGADRHLPPHRRDARRCPAGHARSRPTHRTDLDRPCHRNALNPAWEIRHAPW